MSSPQSTCEPSKFHSLLRLSKDQNQALECNDIAAFNRILSAKRTLIDSLGDSRALVQSDPVLTGIVDEIQHSEKYAEKLLFNRIGRIKQELATIHQADTAKRAYRKVAAKPHAFIRDPETPRFFDIQT